MRLTRKKDESECRISNCFADDWIEEITGVTYYNWKSDKSVCDNCPFEKYINKLADFEDKEEEIGK